jgi:hypothetical protein
VDDRGSIHEKGIYFPLCHYIRSGSGDVAFCYLMDFGAWWGILKTFDPNTGHVILSPFGKEGKYLPWIRKRRRMFKENADPVKWNFFHSVFSSFPHSSSLSLSRVMWENLKGTSQLQHSSRLWLFAGYWAIGWPENYYVLTNIIPTLQKIYSWQVEKYISFEGTVVWDVTPCSLMEVLRHFEAT